MPLHKKHSHPTRDALIEAVIELLSTRNPEDLKVDEVLHNSGISTGSLYHHFKDLADLIDQAMIVRYSDDIDSSISILTQVITSATDASSLAAGLLTTTQRTQGPERAAPRFIRAQTMTRAATNVHFRELLAPEQKRLTDALADLLRELQVRGLFDPSIDPRSGAVFIQAYNIGLIVNDVSMEPVDQNAYVALVSRMLEHTFFTGH